MPWNAAELIRASLTCAQILFAVLLFSAIGSQGGS